MGVVAAHEDLSRLLDRVGITHTLISSARFKTEGSPFEPLSDEAKAAIRADVDTYHRMFVGAIARGRGVSVNRVESGFGELVDLVGP